MTDRLVSSGVRQRRSRRSFLGLIALAIALLTIAGSARPASAHAEPERANPPIDGTVTAAPTVVEIWFGEEVKTDGTSIQVIGPGGIQVDQGDAKVDLFDPERKHVTVSLRPNLGPGVYTVQWQSVSGEDGDVAQGTYQFMVIGGLPVASPVATPMASATSAPVSTGTAVAAAPTATASNSDGNFDSHAFFLSVGVGLIAAAAIFGFWRLVKPSNPKFQG